MRSEGTGCPNLCPFEAPDWNLVIILDFKLHVVPSLKGGVRSPIYFLLDSCLVMGIVCTMYSRLLLICSRWGVGFLYEVKDLL